MNAIAEDRGNENENKCIDCEGLAAMAADAPGLIRSANFILLDQTVGRKSE